MSTCPLTFFFDNRAHTLCEFEFGQQFDVFHKSVNVSWFLHGRIVSVASFGSRKISFCESQDGCQVCIADGVQCVLLFVWICFYVTSAFKIKSFLTIHNFRKAAIVMEMFRRESSKFWLFIRTFEQINLCLTCCGPYWQSPFLLLMYHFNSKFHFQILSDQQKIFDAINFIFNQSIYK